MPAPVAVENASVRFGAISALDGIDIKVADGEKVAVIGPSGAGKTTLLRLLGAALPASTGTISYGGIPPKPLEDPRRARELRSKIGFIHQDHSLVPIYSALQNTLCGRFSERGFWGALRALFLPSRREQLEVHELLEDLGIERCLFARCDTLSGGEKQRVAIARALYQNPKLLIADEPVASVDPARARALLELLLDLSDQRKLTLIASLHDIDLATELFPRLIGLRAGRILFDKSTSAVQAADLERLYALDPGGGSRD